MMKVAIYTRKSIYVDNSDSIKNQIRMCKDYMQMHYPDQIERFLQYEDEAYTGANTNRPALKRMIKDIKSGVIDFLIVYQLDRLSRDVKDFSNIYSLLEEHDVKFISVKENIDTGTPLGRAMMYVSVIFAQLERETTANRVLDNMVGLASSGWWVGGNPPYGYRRLKVFCGDKKHTTIEPVPEEAERVLWFYKTFYNNGFSLQGMESYCKRNNIRTPRNNFFSMTQLYKLLTMPYCVPATPEVYDYYENMGCIMSKESPREQWTGDYGVMIYGRTTERNKKHTLQPPDKWIICIGKHKPFIDPDLWLSVQKQFTHNIFSKTMRYPTTLLKGVIRCSCGRLMGLARRKKKSGEVSTWYLCPRSERQGKDICPRRQIKAEILDGKVIEIFKNIKHNPEIIYQYIEGYKIDNLSISTVAIEREIRDINRKISNLSAAIARNDSSSAAKYILRDIEELDKKLSEKNHELLSLQAEKLLQDDAEKNAAEKLKVITDLLNNFDSFTAEEKNRIACKCIKKCVWDGETLFLTL